MVKSIVALYLLYSWNYIQGYRIAFYGSYINSRTMYAVLIERDWEKTIPTIPNTQNQQVLTYGVLEIRRGYDTLSQILTWLNLRVKPTTLGALISLCLLVQAHEVSSSGSIALNTGKSINVIWLWNDNQNMQISYR